MLQKYVRIIAVPDIGILISNWCKVLCQHCNKSVLPVIQRVAFIATVVRQVIGMWRRSVEKLSIPKLFSHYLKLLIIVSPI